MTRDPKWFGNILRDLRRKAGYSLDGVEARAGFRSVVVGSYERSDRRPTVERAEQLLGFYGMQLAVVPLGYDVPALLRRIADLEEFQRRVLSAAEAEGLVVRPPLAAVPDDVQAA